MFQDSVKPTEAEAKRGAPFIRRVVSKDFEGTVALYDAQGLWLCYIDSARSSLEGLKKSIDEVLAEGI